MAKGLVVTTTPSEEHRGGGAQEQVCLPLEILHGWLFAINANGVQVLPIGGPRLRAVTHYQVTAEGIERALATAGNVLA